MIFKKMSFFLEASTLSVPIWISCSLGLLQSCCLGLTFSVFLGFTFPFSCLEPCFLGSTSFSFWLSFLYLLLPTNCFLKCLNVSCRSKNIFILSSYKNPWNLQTKDKARLQGGDGGSEDSETLAFVFRVTGASNQENASFSNRRTTGLSGRGPICSDPKYLK